MEKRIKRKATFREVKLTTIKNRKNDAGEIFVGKFCAEYDYGINQNFLERCTQREMAIARYHGLGLEKNYPHVDLDNTKQYATYLHYLASIGAFSILDKIFRTTDILAKNNKEKDALLSQARDVASARVKSKQELDNAPKPEDAKRDTRSLYDKPMMQADGLLPKPTFASWCEKYLNISIKELLCIVGFMIAVSLFFYLMATPANAKTDKHAITTIDCPSEEFLIDAMDAALRAVKHNQSRLDSSSAWNRETRRHYLLIVDSRQEICNKSKVGK